MLLTKPTPLEDALKLLREKRLVPTALSSADLRELAAEVKRAALFSARMTQIRPLQALLEGLNAMLEGKGNVADAKLLMTEVYAALGYDPEAGGFPQDKPGTVPPALRGSLRDLSSQKRMELTITTNYRMVANEAFVTRTTEDEQRRHQFPCYELVRIGPRRTPRGFVRRKGALTPVPGEDWPARFVAAGGELYERGTRMIAPKGSDVWIKLGEGAGGYKDTLGNPFAPFAFGSGYGLREVPRAECLLIGVIEEGDEAARMPVTLQKALKAQAKQIDPKILAQFDDLELEDDGEWLRLAREKRAKAEAAYQMRNRLGALVEMLSNRRALQNRMVTLADALDNSRAYIRDHLGRFAKDGGPLTADENIQRGERALARAERIKGDVPRAMFLPGIGRIDFIWGEPGDPKRDYKPGYGVSHIKAKHPGDMAGLVRAMVMGRPRKDPRDPHKIEIIHRPTGEEKNWRIAIVKAARVKDKTPPKPTGKERPLSTAARRAFFKRFQKRRSRTAWLLSGFRKE